MKGMIQMFSVLDIKLQEELLDFVKAEEANKSPKQLNISLITELLRQIINGDREITGIVTNPNTCDVFVRFSYAKET